MAMDDKALLGQEWQTLQDNHEGYEKGALLIKLICIGLCLAGIAAQVAWPWLVVVVLLCWMQEGIFKTYQARLAERLLRVESLIAQAQSSHAAMQLHSEWIASRPGGLGLVTAYAASACRPTVAFPYVPMLLVGGLAKLLCGL